MCMNKPEIMCFAGPNGSGKSTITNVIRPLTHGKYINADDIMRVTFCDAMTAAKEAEALREQCIQDGEEFSFETVLSTERNLNLLKRAKEQGYFIRCVFVLTCSPEINIVRVKNRVLNGGHDVPEDKIVSRYYKSLEMISDLIPICDRISIYDNSGDCPTRIYKKRDSEEFFWENEFWKKHQIEKLVNGK